MIAADSLMTWGMRRTRGRRKSRIIFQTNSTTEGLSPRATRLATSRLLTLCWLSTAVWWRWVSMKSRHSLTLAVFWRRVLQGNLSLAERSLRASLVVESRTREEEAMPRAMVTLPMLEGARTRAWALSWMPYSSTMVRSFMATAPSWRSWARWVMREIKFSSTAELICLTTKPTFSSSLTTLVGISVIQRLASSTRTD